MASIEERALNDKNVKIVNWKDYKNEVLYDEETDDYFTDIDAMVDRYDLEDEKIPKYAYGCKLEPFILDWETILDSEAENHYEEILEHIKGTNELIEAIEKFNKLNENNGSYHQDVMTIVELD